MASKCRFCGAELKDTVLDLGLSPISNEFRHAEDLAVKSQIFYPLSLMVCSTCWLAQLPDVHTPVHFNASYAYFSSYAQSWLEHSRAYADKMISALGLSPGSRVVEVASNDGYLLQYFKRAGIPVLGIEPSANVANAALRNHGIETIVDFFGARLAGELSVLGWQADLIAANNVLAHVPAINDFIAGFKALLKPSGTITFEFPHLLRLMKECQFDTIYHEHYSYLSLAVTEQFLEAHGLHVFAVEELPTHGGSLRVYAGHQGSQHNEVIKGNRLAEVRREEEQLGLRNLRTYAGFRDQVVRRKTDLLKFLIGAREEGKKAVGYGAPAKGNTLINYCGVGPELLPYTVDRNTFKQGKVLPGANIPVLDPERLLHDKPDYVLILPWNLRQEIVEQLSAIRGWGGKFVIAIPELEIF